MAGRTAVNGWHGCKRCGTLRGGGGRGGGARLRGERVSALAARQVHQYDAAAALRHRHAGVRVRLHLGERQREDGVAARRRLVHARLRHRAHVAARHQQLLHLRVRRHVHLAQARHVHAARRVLAYAQRGRRGGGGGGGIYARARRVGHRKQVADLFAVDLQVRAGDGVQVRHAGWRARHPVVNALKQGARDARDEAQLGVRGVQDGAGAHHGVRLAAAGLTVRKHGGVVARKRVVQHAGAQVCKQPLLRRLGVRVVKRKHAARQVGSRRAARRAKQRTRLQRHGVHHRHTVRRRAHHRRRAGTHLRHRQRPHPHRHHNSRAAAAAASRRSNNITDGTSTAV